MLILINHLMLFLLQKNICLQNLFFHIIFFVFLLLFVNSFLYFFHFLYLQKCIHNNMLKILLKDNFLYLLLIRNILEIYLHNMHNQIRMYDLLYRILHLFYFHLFRNFYLNIFDNLILFFCHLFL